MINDMLYSREQAKIHFNEGFGHTTNTPPMSGEVFAGDGNSYKPKGGRGDQGMCTYSTKLYDGITATGFVSDGVIATSRPRFQVMLAEYLLQTPTITIPTLMSK